jgi:hypothetical protein
VTGKGRHGCASANCKTSWNVLFSKQLDIYGIADAVDGQDVNLLNACRAFSGDTDMHVGFAQLLP